MSAFLVERRLMLEVFVAACAQKVVRNIVKQLGPTQTITPVLSVPPVIGPTPMPTNAPNVQKDFIPIKLNRTVAKFVNQVDTIRIRQVTK